VAGYFLRHRGDSVSKEIIAPYLGAAGLVAGFVLMVGHDRVTAGVGGAPHRDPVGSPRDRALHPRGAGGGADRRAPRRRRDRARSSRWRSATLPTALGRTPQKDPKLVLEVLSTFGCRCCTARPHHVDRARRRRRSSYHAPGRAEGRSRPERKCQITISTKVARANDSGRLEEITAAWRCRTG
jgi:hypothetical protein